MGNDSPRITELSWGVVVLEDGRRFKDVKLFPGGARAWDWKETGTRHDPGIQPGDVQELIDRGVTKILLGRGMLGRLGVPDATLAHLEAAGLDVEVCRTEEAARRYNELAEFTRVGALLHSTC